MAKLKSQKKELAEKIAKKKGLRVGTPSYKATVKSLMKLSYPALINLK